MKYLPAVLVVALLAAACSGGNDVDIEGLVTRTPSASPTETATATRAPETATPTGTAPLSTATVTPTVTPSATPTAQVGGDGEEVEAEGLPFSSADVRAAVEAEGYSFRSLDGYDAPCSSTSVQGRLRWSTPGASDFGPLFAFWVYPDEDAMREDWVAEPGERLAPLTDDCELPTGFNYFNANLVLVYLGVPDDGGGLGGQPSPPVPDMREHPAVAAFLELAP